MYTITKKINFDEGEIEFIHTRASGPGGQNVNKVSTAVQLRFDIKKSVCLSGAVKRRLIRLAGRRVTGQGVLVIDAQNHRSQLQNRKDAVNRLLALIRQAIKKPKHRIPSRPTKQSRLKRLETKRQKSDIKRLRKRVNSNSSD